ncbi:MAG TPA: ABC transporter substrate-binding protein [Mycobacteriales bacterium]|nr:ABC transporter substrate-binding protein [Mycobacteriales bacterium]
MVANLSRRNVLRAGAGITMLSAAGCGDFLSMDPEVDKDNGAARPGYKGKEAPILAERVKRGQLPPLAERLPESPMVVKPLHSPGVFGGTLEMAQTDSAAGYDLGDMGRSGIAELDMQTQEPGPGLAESWDISEGGKVYTFHLRKGLRWSDGHPFTADDIFFVHEKIFLNTTLYPSYPAWLVRGGKPPEVTKVDDHTVRFRFAQVHGLLLKRLAFPNDALILICPKHYMSQFLPDFTPMATLKKQAKAHGLDAWNDYFVNRNDIWQNPDRPVLGAFRIVQPGGTSGTSARAERNPYYWKVDEQGRQLPYLDHVHWTFLNSESIALRAAGGELDFGGTSILGFQEVPLLIKNQKRSGYQVGKWVLDGGFAAIYVNQTPKDPVLRTLFQKLDFRAGLSHAINRVEMNEALLAGQGTMLHPCGQPEDEYFVPGMGKRFTEFDVAEANRRLDAAGLTKRGGNGMRLRPDGKRMLLELLTFPINLGIPGVDAYEYVQRYWAKVGVEMTIKNVTSDLWYKRTPVGDYQLGGYPPAGYKWDIDSLWYVPTSSLSYFAPLYGHWYETQGAEGDKPSGIFRKLQEDFDALQNTVDRKKQLELGRGILRAHDQNVWIIGTLRPPFTPMIIDNDLMNVRTDAIASYRTGYEEATRAEQVSFRTPRAH